MPINEDESIVKHVVDFFTQSDEDRDYQAAGGDDRVPPAERTADPKHDANVYAYAHGEDLPYPSHTPIEG